jgi:hypothetical protein
LFFYIAFEFTAAAAVDPIVRDPVSSEKSVIMKKTTSKQNVLSFTDVVLFSKKNTKP